MKRFPKLSRSLEGSSESERHFDSVNSSSVWCPYIIAFICNKSHHSMHLISTCAVTSVARGCWTLWYGRSQLVTMTTSSFSCYLPRGSLANSACCLCWFKYCDFELIAFLPSLFPALWLSLLRSHTFELWAQSVPSGLCWKSGRNAASRVTLIVGFNVNRLHQQPLCCLQLSFAVDAVTCSWTECDRFWCRLSLLLRSRISPYAHDTGL